MTRNITKIWLLGSGSGPRAQKCDKHMKIKWIKCGNDVNLANHIIFTFFSYYFHIFITCLGSGPRSGPQKSYFCHIPGHIFFILFSYFCENLVFRPVHTDNLYKQYPSKSWDGGRASPPHTLSWMLWGVFAPEPLLWDLHPSQAVRLGVSADHFYIWVTPKV